MNEKEQDMIRILWVLEGLKEKTTTDELAHLEKAIGILSSVSGVEWGE